MGAWGAGSFENDAAMDFALEIERAEDLLDPLTVVKPDTLIEADDACRMIVVAECVAAMRGHPSDQIPDELFRKIQGFGRPGRSLYLHARERIQEVLNKSELLDLWAEGNPDEFIKAVHELIGRLNLRATYATPPARKGKKKFYEEEWFKESKCCFCYQPLGEQDFVSFHAKINEGTDSEGGLWVRGHLACWNSALHYKLRQKPFSMHLEDVGEDDAMFDILEQKPTLEN